VYLVVELARSRTPDLGGWTVLASIPGREGTLSYQWLTPTGLLSEGQLADVAHRLVSLVDDAVFVVDGGCQAEFEIAE
jgi:hypothetical protein